MFAPRSSYNHVPETKRFISTGKEKKGTLTFLSDSVATYNKPKILKKVTVTFFKILDFQLVEI